MKEVTRILKANEADKDKVYYDVVNQIYVKARYTPNDGGYWYWANWNVPDAEEGERIKAEAEEILAKPDDDDLGIDR